MAHLRKPVKSLVAEKMSTVRPDDWDFVSLGNATHETSNFKILLVDDHPADADNVRNALAELPDHPVELVVVQTLGHALDALGRDTFHAILLDLDLPDSSGLDTLLRVRERAKQVSIVVLAGQQDEEFALKAIRAGAQDCLAKLRLTGTAFFRILKYASERQRSINEISLRRRELSTAYTNLAKLLNSNADGVLVVDDAGIVRFANPAATVLFGSPQKGLVGWPLPLPTIPKENAEIELGGAERSGSIVEARVVDLEWNGEPVFLLTLRDITIHKRSQEALRENERRLSTLLSNLSGMVYRCRNDDDWTMEFVSEGAFALTGYRQKQIAGNSEIAYATIIHPDDREAVWNEVQAALDERRPFELIYRIRTANGEQRWVKEQGLGVLSADGELCALEGFIYDITKLKNAEIQLERQHSLLEAIFQAVPDATVITDLERKIILCNPAATAMFGYQVEEIIGQKTAILYESQEEYERQGRLRYNANGASEAASYVVNYRRTNGELFPGETVGSPMRNSQGELIGFIGVIRDITERQRKDVQLRKLSQAVEQSPASVVITNIDGSIEYVNRKFEEVTGYAAAEAIGQNPKILSSKETSAKEYAELWRIIGAGGIWRGEFHNRRKNGELFWEFATIGPIKAPDGTTIKYLAIKEDITERKCMEQRLAQSQKMQAVGQLTGGVAHDFNNLLTVVVGSLGLVREHFDGDERLRKLLDNAYDAGKRGAELVSGLLSFSRTQTLRPEQLDPNETVSKSIKLLGRTLGAQVEIKLVPGAGLGTIHCDPVQLQSALFNLAINARDAMPDGGILTIETRSVTLGQAYTGAREEVTPGPYVQLTVQDTGTGMSPAVIKHVFEPFYTTKEVGKGSGLGLSMVHGFVKQSGGHIEIYSEEGHGTAVKLFFPRLASDKDNPEEEAASETLPLNGSETILVVEDDPHVRDISVTMLEDLGYQVLEAETGQSALDVLETHPEVAIVFSDVVMPGGMNGVELAKRVRQRYPGKKVLLTSGYTRDAMSKHGDLDDDIELLLKPFDGARLAHTLRDVLQQPAPSLRV